MTNPPNPDWKARALAVEAERDEAMRLMSRYAAEAGEAKGRLEMSEAAGIVDGWRERALAAEARAERAEAALPPKADAELVERLKDTIKWAEEADAWELATVMSDALQAIAALSRPADEGWRPADGDVEFELECNGEWATAVNAPGRSEAPPAPPGLLERVVEALEPFAEGAMCLHPAHPDDGLTLDGIEVRAWRRAYSVLAELRGEIERAAGAKT